MSFGFISGNKSPVIWRGPLVSRMTEQFLWMLIGDLDILILDLPPGTGDIQLTLTQKIKITGAIIVTTPQDIALSDVRKGADMFKKVNTPVLGVIENMSGLILSGNTTDPNSKIQIENQELEIDKNGNFHLNIDIFTKKDGGQKEVKDSEYLCWQKYHCQKILWMRQIQACQLLCPTLIIIQGKVYFNLADPSFKNGKKQMMGTFFYFLC